MGFDFLEVFMGGEVLNWRSGEVAAGKMSKISQSLVFDSFDLVFFFFML